MPTSVLRSPASDDLSSAVERVAAFAASRAERLDAEGGSPDLEIDALARNGLQTAPFAPALGGAGLASGEAAARELPRCLAALGGASLPTGRLYEGHVNAVRLIETHGSARQKRQLAEEARSGALFGVWAADETPQNLMLHREADGWRLEGRKIYCSGASLIRRAILTAKDEAGQVRLLMPTLPPGHPADLGGWAAQGMRASLTGTVDFTGLSVCDDDIVGEPDAYHREPDFSGGAWRFLAVHLGGMEGLFDHLVQHLNQFGRGGDPHQAARLGEAAVAVETARLWVTEAANRLERRQGDAAAIVAYVCLARTAVERGALDLMERVQRSVGLQAFLRPNPIERMTRDLATYLRQPGPDRAKTTAAAWFVSRPPSSWPGR